MATTRAATFEGPGPDAVFHDNLKQDKFRIQHCNACDRNFFYPRALCVHCGSADWQWIDASGKGTVYSTSVVRMRPEDGADYNIALVDLAEGPRMMSRVTDIPPAEVKIGMEVEAYIGELDKQTLVLFRPAGR
jgi:uncharacterized OB-fold protein